MSITPIILTEDDKQTSINFHNICNINYPLTDGTFS